MSIPRQSRGYSLPLGDFAGAAIGNAPTGPTAMRPSARIARRHDAEFRLKRGSRRMLPRRFFSAGVEGKARLQRFRASAPDHQGNAGHHQIGLRREIRRQAVFGRCCAYCRNFRSSRRTGSGGGADFGGSPGG